MLQYGSAGGSEKTHPLWDVYGRLNRFCWETPNPPVITRAAKVYFRNSFVVKPWKLFGFAKYAGYKGHKLKSMLNTYLSEERIALVGDRIKRREGRAGRIGQYHSIGIPMGTGAKDNAKKTGECITGMSISLVPKRDSETKEQAVNVQVFFRVSEVTRRLLGDFIFIDYVLWRILQPCGLMDSLNTVTLHFGSFYCILYHYVLWLRMFPEAAELRSNQDRFPEKRWKSHLFEGTTGLSSASRKPLTHSPKIVTAAIYKGLAKAPSLYVYKGGSVVLRKGCEEYDGQPHRT